MLPHSFRAGRQSKTGVDIDVTIVSSWFSNSATYAIVLVIMKSLRCCLNGVAAAILLLAVSSDAFAPPSK